VGARRTASLDLGSNIWDARRHHSGEEAAVGALTDNTPAPALTAAQVADYRSEGFTVVDDVFSSDECDVIIEHHERAAFELDLGRREDGQMKYRPMVHLTDPFLCEAACDARWAGIVVPLVGPDARLYWEQSVCKPPGTGCRGTRTTATRR
jgi:hypothetical protein